MLSNSEIIKQLDSTLNWLSERNQIYAEHNDVKEAVFNNHPVDVEAILLKLKNDGLIHYGLNIGNTTKFKISIDGYDLIRNGGYKYKYEEDARIQSIATKQIDTAIQANESAVKVNLSTEKLNEVVLPKIFLFQTKYGKWSLCLAGLSSLFILVTIYQQVTDKTESEIEKLREVLNNQSSYLKKIESSLQEINFSIQQKKADTVYLGHPALKK